MRRPSVLHEPIDRTSSWVRPGAACSSAGDLDVIICREMRITGCTSVYLADLSVRYGATAIHIELSDDIRLDHVTVRAGSYGVNFGDKCTNSSMTHCLVDGGMPPWYFRSDRKGGYKYLLPDGTTAETGSARSPCAR